MQSWLLMAAASQAAATLSASPQMSGLARVDIGPLAKAHSLDFRLKQDSQTPGPVPLVRGMIVHHDVAPNAAVGLGLSSLYDRRRSGLQSNVGPPTRHTRNPAVTFVLKF